MALRFISSDTLLASLVSVSLDFLHQTFGYILVAKVSASEPTVADWTIGWVKTKFPFSPCSQPASQPANQPASLPASQPTNQAISLPASHIYAEML